MRRTGARRGNNAVEFALTLPVYLVFLAGVTDYGWYFNQHMRTTMVARDSARAAAMSLLGEPVEQNGENQAATSLQVAGLTAAPGSPPDCVLTGAAPDQEVVCTIVATYESMIGLVPIPATLDASVTMRMEVQP